MSQELTCFKHYECTYLVEIPFHVLHLSILIRLSDASAIIFIERYMVILIQDFSFPSVGHLLSSADYSVIPQFPFTAKPCQLVFISFS